MAGLDDRQLDSGALGRRIGVDPYLRDYAFAPRNLLTPNQASLETDTTGWAASTNTTIAWSNAVAAVGSGSLALTSVAAGNMLAQTLPNAAAVPVIVGRVYSAVASFRSAVSARSVRVDFQWFTAAGTYVSASTGTVVTDSTSVWVEARNTVVAPATAAYANVVAVVVSAGAAAEVHYVDKIGFWEGAGGTWVPGGERLDPGSLGHYWDESVGRREFSWDTTNSRWQLVYGDTGWRDVSASILSSWTGTLYLRREGNRIDFIGAGLSKTSATADSLLTLPAGFTAAISAVHVGVGIDTTTLGWCPCYMSGTNVIVVPRAAIGAGNQGRVNMTFTSTGAWPATNPGTAVGTIPFA
jgi:hypothetical protein